MNPVNNENQIGFAASPDAPAQGRLELLARSQHSLVSKLVSLNSRTRVLSDRLFGPRPAEDSSAKTQTTTPTVDDLDITQNELRGLMEELSDEIARLEEL